MTRSALYDRVRPIALGEATNWRIPGMDPDDIRQECLVAAWCATDTWDREQGPLSAYARRAIKNHCADLLRAATRQKRTCDIDPDGLDTASSPDVSVVVEHREQLQLALDMAPELTREAQRRNTWAERKRQFRAKATA